MKFLSTICFLLFKFTSVSSQYNMVAEPRVMLTTPFVPQIVSKTCLLKPNEGPCRGKIEMYYFNPASKSCSTFAWGGCQGNGNRFDTIDECEDACLTKKDDPSKRPRYCNLSFDYGFCFGGVKRWYFDKMWNVCKETVYSGCGGNKNNFYSFEQCDSVCRLRKGSLFDEKYGAKTKYKKVVYVYTNGTRRTTLKPASRSTATSPKPRYHYRTTKGPEVIVDRNEIQHKMLYVNAK